MTPCILVHRYHTVSSANTATTSNQDFLYWPTAIFHTSHLFIWQTVHRLCWPAVICNVWWFYSGSQIFLSVFLLYFLFWPILPNDCRCRWLLLQLITLNDTHVDTYTHTPHHTRWESYGWGMGPSQRPLPYNTQHSEDTDIHAPYGILTHNPSKRAAANPHLWPGSYTPLSLDISIRLPFNFWFVKVYKTLVKWDIKYLKYWNLNCNCKM